MSRNSSILLAQIYCGIVAVLFMGIQNTYVVERASKRVTSLILEPSWPLKSTNMT